MSLLKSGSHYMHLHFELSSFVMNQDVLWMLCTSQNHLQRTTFVSFSTFICTLKLKTQSQLTQSPFTGTDCLFIQIKDLLQEQEKDYVIWCGDFNIILILT